MKMSSSRSIQSNIYHHQQMNIALKLILFLLFYFIIIFSNTYVTPLRTDLVPITRKIPPQYYDILNEIVNDCYPDLNKVLLIEKFYDQLRPSFILPLTKLKFTKIVIDTDELYRFVTPILDVDHIDATFIVTDAPGLVPIILLLINYVHMISTKSPMFIFDVGNERKILPPLDKLFWSKWGISTFYYIFEAQNTIVVFTGNPYSSYAPKPWGFVRERDMRLFGRDYIKGELCQGFVFDRTKDLRQYVLRLLSFTAGVSGFYEGVIQKYCSHWHEARPIFEKAFGCKTITYCEATRNWDYSTKLIDEYKPDVILTGTRNNKYERSYPPQYMALSIVSYVQGYRTLFEEIYSLFGKWIILYTSVLLLITFFVCYHLAKTDKIAFATFEIIRLLISASIMTSTNRLALRIFFINIFLYFLLIQSLFQGKLAKFLTNPESYKNAETLDDLESPVYKRILYNSYDGTLESNKIVMDKARRVNSKPELATEFMKNKFTAFVDHLQAISDLLKISPDDLYVSRTPISRKPFFYHLRKNNPLNERINTLFLRHYEIGFDRMREVFESMAFMREIGKKKAILLTKGVNKPIDLKSIMPLMILLALGWISATVSFMSELIIHYLQNLKRLRDAKKVTKQRLQPNNIKEIAENRNDDDDCMIRVQ